MPTVSTSLLRWYSKHKRDLAWRKTNDPYKILVSEIMLQQTQVDRVKVFYKNWLNLFPDWKELAQASNADVIRAWSGLGYNRRALALRDIAKQVQEKGVPRTREEWLELKGVGPYTSAAVALFAQAERVFPVDSIIRRVMGRIYLNEPFIGLKQDAAIEKLGLKLLNDIQDYQSIPQALFDLGTEVCKKEPECSACPLKSSCLSSMRFLAGEIKIPKRSIIKNRERIHSGKKHPDRIYRGRILKVVKESPKPLRLEEVISFVDKGYNERSDAEWFGSMLKRLTKEGFLREHEGRYMLEKN